MTEKISNYEYVEYLVTNQLNGIKYLYGSQIVSLYAILHKVSQFDLDDRKACECALASVKEAVQIYFGFNQGVDLGEPFPSHRKIFKNLTVDNIVVSEWQGKKSFGGNGFGGGIMFHIAHEPIGDEDELVESVSSKESLEAWAYELKQRIKWWCDGINIHCLSLDVFWKTPTERICELYNVDLSFFKK